MGILQFVGSDLHGAGFARQTYSPWIRNTHGRAFCTGSRAAPPSVFSRSAHAVPRTARAPHSARRICMVIDGNEAKNNPVQVRSSKASSPSLSVGLTLDTLETKQTADDLGMFITHVYRATRTEFGTENKARKALDCRELTVQREDCFNILSETPFSQRELDVVAWLLGETYEMHKLSAHSQLPQASPTASFVVEVGPRLNFQTAWSSNAVSVFKACGLAKVSRIERSRRYFVSAPAAVSLSASSIEAFVALVHDRMTEQPYVMPLESFDSGLEPAPTGVVDLLGLGVDELHRVNAEQGLGFDEWDVRYYYELFAESLKRNPTNVELFDMAQSNSEHSRHWFFKGKLVIDGEEQPQHLFDVVRDTLRANPRNSVVAFADNSSTIRGYTAPLLVAQAPGEPSSMALQDIDLDVLCTAETHNFPSGVAPFPGAETGAGGRMRDSAATGTGSLLIAGFAGYAVGNLQLDNYALPWESDDFEYPSNLASARQITIEASNGASDYGNKFGEPLICGFARSYGLRDAAGSRREFVKPIMFSGGLGQMYSIHARKKQPQTGMLVVKVGGPAYRIGMGGGAASSMVQGANKAELDLNAVQRGDAEMAQKTYRVLRACVEMGEQNPILSLHDQGAGGNCNVVKELIEPLGARINLREIVVGDASLSAVEIWGAEYQENFGLLLAAERLPSFERLCAREKTLCSVLGEIDGSGKIVLYDSKTDTVVEDLELDAVLGELPQKTYVDKRVSGAERARMLSALHLRDVGSIGIALDRVLRLMTVCSKRFLTTKVDRSVTGLVAQQQTVGALQLPLADVGVVAQSMFALTGAAVALGECPSLTPLSPQAMARMAVAEMLTNMCAARITAVADIKCEGNWMWAAKLPGEGADLYDAACAMRELMITLGIAIDGGKDSVSMAARCGDELVKAPGTLVVSGYVTVNDVRQKLTPDIKRPGGSSLLLVQLGGTWTKSGLRLGGSALAQVFNVTASTPPDIDDATVLLKGLDTLLALQDEEHRRVAPLAYHDVSSGGLLVCLLEMAFAGDCGLEVRVPSSVSPSVSAEELAKVSADQADTMETAALGFLFAEEAGVVIEVDHSARERVMEMFKDQGVPCLHIAETLVESEIVVRAESETGSVSTQSAADESVSAALFRGDVRKLRDTWEATSFELEKMQAEEHCVASEQALLQTQAAAAIPRYQFSMTPRRTPSDVMGAPSKHRVAVIREEGSNGDREMSAAFVLAGFEPWDVHVNDLVEGRVSLDGFRGVVFVGGFSYADVLDSAKGWAGTIRFRDNVRAEFERFYARSDTFSLGVCNGCQLMALLGIVPFGMDELPGSQQPRFVHNDSGRYESRFSTVRIAEQTPSIMLKGLGASQLGVWVAHGEGKAFFPDEAVLERAQALGLTAMHYVDAAGAPTERYPLNPNGSARGIAALCSPDGRHLAMMPHPERAVLEWQWPFRGKGSDTTALMPEGVSPWLCMFQNARVWCDEHTV
ncbi:putative phosphoribosylformylglycinamidine synthase, chloroplastic/mitochondrial [Porphyridium purpureum]|uniref:phosphoribosylformylglycinamidine synthase n=1 Tax=Porphyridium purpureum TaxID=35688 RepID=A0A5J4Z3A4_PORPP|nr:putative phosphoribosylformylglycinamidine synthase, chloroplastic/mitochondrial [Porphyridium purpureum]|eukprot:POR7533..scf295_1